MSDYLDDDPEELAWQAEQVAAATERRARELAEQLDRERRWAAENPAAWAEWVRLRPLLDPLHDLFADRPYDFEEFVREVGPPPSVRHRVRRRDEAKPYRKGNLTWGTEGGSDTPRQSPYFTVEEAAAHCRVSVKTIYNHTSLGNIKSMPGTGKSLYRRESLDDWLSTPPGRRKTKARR